YNLGVRYDNGRGVRQDYTQAVQWYRKAAEQGLADAQYNLGMMYANGQGVRPRLCRGSAMVSQNGRARACRSPI
ncbi:TPA: sel1 repeat family protein, partial [Streptococcus agalactiae]|nr:sel1 repeat family protein [Streptococcus agalactiae]